MSTNSTFDFIISYFTSSHHDGPQLTAILKAAKPGAKFRICEKLEDASQLSSQLKLNGFTNLSNPRTVSDQV